MGNNTSSSRIYPWLVVAMLWIVALLNYMDRQMLSTMQASIGVTIPAIQDPVNFGRLMAIFLWIYAIMSPASGAIADRLSRKWLIVGSLAVWSAVTLCMGYCTTFGQLYGLRAVMGISEALYIPAALSLIAEYFTGSSRSLAIGIHMTGLYMGQALGGFGAAAAMAFTWQSTFKWFGLVGVAYALVLCFCLREYRTAPAMADSASVDDGGSWLNKMAKGFAMIFSTTAFWVILFFFASISLPGWATKNWLPTLFADSLGVDMTTAGPMATIAIAVSSFFGVMLGAPLSDRWVKRNPRGRIYISSIGIAMMIPSIVLIGLGHNMLTAIAAALLFGLGYGMVDSNNMPILCQFVAPRQRASAYGILNTVGVLMGALTTTLLGDWASDGNLGLGFALMGAVLLVAVMLQLFVLRPTTDDKTE